MSKKEKKQKGIDLQADIHLDIPEDEIWTYQVEGLAAPHINKPYKHYTLKKIVLALVIIVAVSLSIYFSVRTVQSEVFEYSQTDSGYQFDKFSNTGYITELDIDYISSVSYDNENKDPATNFIINKDNSKKVTAIREYAFNCDGAIKVVNIGADVLEIDGKSFYSCWALERIEVDENNPNYCDVDGVLYNKDMTEVICYPCNHDEYLRQKYGYEKELYKDEVTPEYQRNIQTYVVPSTVKTLGELCFNYANLREIYLPEGLETIETLAVFKLHERVDEWSTTPSLSNIYTYKTDKQITDPHFTSQEALGEIYLSLPEGLKFIGSDAFSYNQTLSYVYIPSSVTEIGHHAFWDTVYKEDDTLKGVSVINVAVSEEDFNSVDTGDNWRPQYDYLLFKKSVDVAYDTERVAYENNVVPEPNPEPSPEPAPEPSPELSPKPENIIHTVSANETLWDIAEEYLGSGSRFYEIMFSNDMKSEEIYVGQEISITTKNNRVHVVVEGDTLWSIAEEYLGDGSRYAEIMELNGIKSEGLWIGQEITIPE